MLIGGIDAGGTSINCAVTKYSDKKPDIIQRTNIETSTPDESLPQILEFFNYLIGAFSLLVYKPHLLFYYLILIQVLVSLSNL